MRHIIKLTLALIICSSCVLKHNIVVTNNKPLLPEGSIPISYDYGRLYVEGSINNLSSVRMILDNGATVLSMDSTYLADNNNHGIQINKKNIVGVASPHGRFFCPTITNNTILNIDGQEYNYNFAYVSDKQKYFYMDSIQGMVPMKSLATKRYLEVNLQKKYIRPLEEPDTKGYKRIPFKEHSCDAFIVETSFTIIKDGKEYHKKGTSVLDYGNPHRAFTVNKQLLAEEKGIKSDTCEMYQQGRTKENNQLYLIKAESLQFDMPVKTTFKDIKLEFRNNDILLPEDGSLCWLGTKYLENFETIIDYKENVLYMRPIKTTVRVGEEKIISKWGLKVFPFRSKSATGTYPHKWKVNSTIRGTKAYERGIRPGDVVEKINGKDASNLSITQGLNMLKNPTELQIRHAGNIITLK